MNSKYMNANVPGAEGPFGDLGHKGTTWTPGEEQGVSNRLADAAGEEKGDEDEEDDDFDEDDDEAAEEEEEDEDDAEEAEEPTVIQ